MRVFISAKDYDKIKDGDDVELVVEARNRAPMSVYVSPMLYSVTKSNDAAGYENAKFNGEAD